MNVSTLLPASLVVTRSYIHLQPFCSYLTLYLDKAIRTTNSVIAFRLMLHRTASQLRQIHLDTLFLASSTCQEVTQRPGSFQFSPREPLDPTQIPAASSRAQPMHIISDSNLIPASHIQADSRRCFVLSEGFLVHPHTQAFIWDLSVERNQMVLWTSITFCSLAV